MSACQQAWWVAILLLAPAAVASSHTTPPPSLTTCVYDPETGGVTCHGPGDCAGPHRDGNGSSMHCELPGGEGPPPMHIPPKGPRGGAFRFEQADASAHLQADGVTSLTTRIESLHLYEDGNGNGALDLGEAVERSYEVAALNVSVAASSGTPGWEVAYDLQPGQLVLRFHTQPAADVVTKFDVEIRDALADASLRWALVQEVRIADGVRFVDVGGEPALAGWGESAFPYLSWTPYSEVNGTRHPVVATAQLSSERASAAILVWNYPAGHVVHDPAFGIMRVLPATLGEAGVYLGTLAGVALVGLAGFEVRRRWAP